MGSEDGFRMVNESGWLSGLLNMLRLEHSRWWDTRQWVVQSAVWLALLNGLHALILYLETLERGNVVVNGAPFDSVSTVLHAHERDGAHWGDDTHAGQRRPGEAVRHG